jgi:acetyl-CoA C-acetyltransferase
MTDGTLDPRSPVLVGWAAVNQARDDPAAALEASALMTKAVQAAAARAGAPALLGDIERIYVPKGRWSYRNPGRAIARAIGAPDATCVLSTVGVLQQTLIGDACRRIAEGEIGTALVVGGDTGHRILRAAIAKTALAETQQEDEADVVLAPHDELRHPAERRVGLKMAVGLYAIVHSAHAAARGDSVAVYRDRIARLFSEFSAVAAENLDAWKRQAVPPQQIREPTERNPMQAFPYTKLHCANWNVDQAAALILCSAEKARALGIAPERWIHPLASTESNHMMQVSTRADLGGCPGARIAGQAALDAAGLTIEKVDRLELYSCFPAAVELYAAELGVPAGRRPLTVTGGMPFAGGPYNNYVFQATSRMADLLLQDGQGRAGAAATGLVASVSGIVTKQGFGLWSSGPGRGFDHADVTAQVAGAARTMEVAMDFDGPGVVAGYTVLHEKGGAPKGVAVVDTADGRRAVAATLDPALIARMESEPFCGAPVSVSDGHVLTAAGSA